MGLLDFLLGAAIMDRASNHHKNNRNHSSGYNNSYERGYEDGYEDSYHATTSIVNIRPHDSLICKMYRQTIINL